MDIFTEYLMPVIIQIGAVLGAAAVIKKWGAGWIDGIIIGPIQRSIKCMDMDYCKGYLVDFMTDIKNGEQKTEIQIRYAHEKYDHYVSDLGGNSYIHDEWQELKDKGRI